MSISVGGSRRVVIGACVAALSLGALVPAMAASAARATGVAEFPVGRDFYGVNYDLQNARRFRADSKVDQQIAALDPATIRWPGGTEADFYNWRTRKGRKSGSFVFTLKDLANAVAATHAVPMFDLNVLADPKHPANQVAMLKRAHDHYHLPISYVELGNELYFPGPTLSTAPKGAFIKGFPTGTSYGNTVARYVRAVHHAFPKAKVAADTILHPAKNNIREDTWNAEMMTAAKGSGAPDAVILHDYPGPSFRNLKSGDLSRLFTGAYTAAQQIQAKANALGQPAWLTEFNLEPGFNHKGTKPAKNPVQLSYAHELYVAALAAMLPRIHDLAGVDNYGALGNTGILGAWAEPKAGGKLTPYGQAIEFADTAGQDATSTAPIAIPADPTVHAGDPAVLGQTFLGARSRTRAVLVNLTDKRHTVPLQPGIAAGKPYEYVTGNPMAHQTIATQPHTGTVGRGGLTLPPYSVTLLGVRSLPAR
jgi:hypothetical protein